MRLFFVPMRKIFTIFLLILLPSSAFCCDICNIYEYNGLENSSFIGFFYRYRMFNGYAALGNTHSFRFLPNARVSHEPEETGLFANKSPQDYETYTTYELRGNFVLKQKINLQFILPWEENLVYYAQILKFPNPQTDTTFNPKGWGDLTLAADYIFEKRSGNFTHTFRPGLALRFPTGQYRKEAGNGKPHDPIIQPGTAAFACIFRANYQLRYKKMGLSSALNFQLSGKGKQGYHFANRLNFTADLFRKIPLGNFVLLPKIGAYVENSGHDSFQEKQIALSGGTVWFANLGTDIHFKKWVLLAAYQRPFAQNLNGNQIGNAGRLNLGLLRLF